MAMKPGARDLAGWAISVDLWGTLITYGDRTAEAEWRLAEFGRVLGQFSHPRDPEVVRDAVLGVRGDTRARQRAGGEQPPVREQVQQMLDALGVPDPSPRMLKALLVVHTHAVLRACPQLIPGGPDALRELRGRGAWMTLTSNTLATPGSVSRLILEEHDLTGLFDDLVFSSDLGIAKPRAEVFAAVAARAQVALDRVVHVGNSVTTDVDGALAAGCRAVLFNPRGNKTCPAGAVAVASLADLPAAITAACAGLHHERTTC